MARIHVGTSGWSYEHWSGLFYPEDLPKNQWLTHYARHFDTVELNMSFYRYPFPNILKGWKKKIPEDFTMTFKAHRQITHRKKFRDTEEDLKKFYSLVEQMGDQSGCILFQAPPSFHCNQENLALLEGFLKNTDPRRKNVMEFRHSSWWNEQVHQLLKKHHVAFCSVSGLSMPEQVMCSSNIAYFRFHGPDTPYASKYNREQLSGWADAIRQLISDQQVREVFCYFNNDYYGYALEDARTLKGFLR